MQHDTDLIPFNELSRALREHGVTKNYGQLWRAANEGQFPVMRAGGRIFVNANDIAAIASTFTQAEG